MIANEFFLFSGWKFRRQSLLHKMISYEDNADWEELKSSCIFHLIEVTRKWSQDPQDIQHTDSSLYNKYIPLLKASKFQGKSL